MKKLALALCALSALTVLSGCVYPGYYDRGYYRGGYDDGYGRGRWHPGYWENGYWHPGWYSHPRGGQNGGQNGGYNNRDNGPPPQGDNDDRGGGYPDGQ
jgi:hypothetical protein